MTLLYFSAQNIDRLVSFYRASLKTGKISAIDFYTANILGCLKDYARIPYPSENYTNIRVFFPYWLCRRITQQGGQELMYRYKSYKITRKEISDRSGGIMMMVRPSMLKDLELIKNIAGATFIYSLWEGYLQDYSLQKMMKFIKKKNMNFYQVHTSGHAEIDTLKKVVKKLKPGKIVPIHTFHPDKYSALFSRKIVQVKKIDVKKFVRYLIKFPVIAVRKRAGLMLERAGVSLEELSRLKSSIDSENSYTSFNPFIKSRKGSVNQDWKVILNG